MTAGWKKLAALAICVGLITALGGCHASGSTDDHKGDVKVEGNK